jgi:hypothetical protein
MKSIQAMLAVGCLLIVSGAIDAARADDRAEENQGVTLYTPVDRGDRLTCRAVNVSDKTLGITVAVLGLLGEALSCASPTTCFHFLPPTPTTNPTPEFQVLKGTVSELDITFPLGSAEDGYCAVAVSGTGNRDDVRVSLVTSLTRTIPGTGTPGIPIFITRVVEGH